MSKNANAFTRLLITSLMACGISLQADLLNPDADTFVQRSSATSNFGTASELRVKNEGGNNVRKTYVRFDLSSLPFDHTTQLGRATLKLNFYDGSLGNGGTANTWGFQVYGLNDGDAGENWGETAITWNDAPQNDTNSGNRVLAGATSLGTFSFVGREADVDFSTPLLRDFVSASTSDDLLSFIVVRDTPGGGADTYVHYIAASDHPTEQGPQLELNMIPEPSVSALLGLGVLLLARRARKATV